MENGDNISIWEEITCKSGHHLYMLNKKTGQRRWPVQHTNDNINEIIIKKEMSSIGTQTDDYGCINHCLSMFVNPSNSLDSQQYSLCAISSSVCENDSENTIRHEERQEGIHQEDCLMQNTDDDNVDGENTIREDQQEGIDQEDCVMPNTDDDIDGENTISKDQQEGIDKEDYLMPNTDDDVDGENTIREDQQEGIDKEDCLMSNTDDDVDSENTISKHQHKGIDKEDCVMPNTDELATLDGENFDNDIGKDVRNGDKQHRKQTSEVHDTTNTDNDAMDKEDKDNNQVEGVNTQTSSSQRLDSENLCSSVANSNENLTHSHAINTTEHLINSHELESQNFDSDSEDGDFNANIDDIINTILERTFDDTCSNIHGKMDGTTTNIPDRSDLVNDEHPNNMEKSLDSKNYEMTNHDTDADIIADSADTVRVNTQDKSKDLNSVEPLSISKGQIDLLCSHSGDTIMSNKRTDSVNTANDGTNDTSTLTDKTSDLHVVNNEKETLNESEDNDNEEMEDCASDLIDVETVSSESGEESGEESETPYKSEDNGYEEMFDDDSGIIDVETVSIEENTNNQVNECTNTADRITCNPECDSGDDSGEESETLNESENNGNKEIDNGDSESCQSDIDDKTVSSDENNCHKQDNEITNTSRREDESSECDIALPGLLANNTVQRGTVDSRSHCKVTLTARIVLKPLLILPHTVGKPATNNQAHNNNVDQSTPTEDVKPHKCEYCQKAFAKESILMRHELVHTGAKPYRCSYCKKRFSERGNLVQHIKVHTGDKPFECNSCEKTFNRNSDLTRHQRTHTGLKPYKCDICDKAFAQIGTLKHHEQVHTGEKPHKCRICKRSFTLRSNLKVHQRRHTGQKPFKCDTCGKSFRQKCTLKEHQIVHSQERPFKCLLCEKGFCVKNKLTRHQLTVHV